MTVHGKYFAKASWAVIHSCYPQIRPGGLWGTELLEHGESTPDDRPATPQPDLGGLALNPVYDGAAHGVRGIELSLAAAWPSAAR
jgi:hypothetical protein